jgi:hypothetical protein
MRRNTLGAWGTKTTIKQGLLRYAQGYGADPNALADFGILVATQMSELLSLGMSSEKAYEVVEEAINSSTRASADTTTPNKRRRSKRRTSSR